MPGFTSESEYVPFEEIEVDIDALINLTVVGFPADALLAFILAQREVVIVLVWFVGANYWSITVQTSLCLVGFEPGGIAW